MTSSQGKILTEKYIGLSPKEILDSLNNLYTNKIKWFIVPKYESVQFSNPIDKNGNTLFFVNSSPKMYEFEWSVIDTIKNLITPTKFHGARAIRPNMIGELFLRDSTYFLGKSNIVDTLNSFNGSKVDRIKDYQIYKTSDNKYYYKNIKTGYLSDSVYSDLYINFYDDFICVLKGNKWGLIDSLENIKIPFIYDYVRLHNKDKNLYTVHLAGKHGLVNIKNEVILPINYFLLGGVENGNLISVKHKDKWGFIDFKGNIRINPEYDMVFPFNNSTAWAVKENRYLLIDTLGSIKFTSTFYKWETDLKFYSDGKYLINSNKSKAYLLNNLGEIVYEFNNNNIIRFQNEIFYLDGEIVSMLNSKKIIPKELFPSVPSQYGNVGPMQLKFLGIKDLILNKYGLIKLEENSELINSIE